MAKQPYIPFYIGDYIKDTRKLPLSVRGAWVDLLLFMWEEEHRGEITATIEEYAGILSCTKEEANFAVNLLIEKRVCNHEKIAGGKIKIISRRMKRDIEISLKRSESGKKGIFAKKNKKQNSNNQPELALTKTKQNPDIDYEYDNEGGNGIVFKDESVKEENWDDAKQSFFVNEGWMYKFCTEKRIDKFVLENKMKDFITDIELKRDFKSLRGLQKHFTNWYNKYFNGNGSTTHQRTSENGSSKKGTSDARIDALRKW